MNNEAPSTVDCGTVVTLGTDLTLGQAILVPVWRNWAVGNATASGASISVRLTEGNDLLPVERNGVARSSPQDS